jgi:hypothetical protein
MQNNLTIVAVDTAYPELTRAAIDQAVKVTNAKEVLVLSDTDFYPGSRWVQIEPINQVDYSRVVLKDLGSYVETDHYLCIQYDGMPTDSKFWDDEYLKYDYIGAPWPWGAPNRKVGNGGFSLRSRKLAQACQDPQIVFDPPGHGDNNYMEDLHICVMYADYLEKQYGIKYAPVDLAKKFSAEIPGGKFDTYGFHGTLCLPYYLSDDHMELYINNMNERQFKSDFQSRIVFGLFLAERWELMEHMMDRGTEIVPDFKQRLIEQLPKERNYFPNLSVEDLENILVNYE